MEFLAFIYQTPLSLLYDGCLAEQCVGLDSITSLTKHIDNSVKIPRFLAALYHLQDKAQAAKNPFQWIQYPL